MVKCLAEEFSLAYGNVLKTSFFRLFFLLEFSFPKASYSFKPLIICFTFYSFTASVDLIL